jgi:hypothetical protein
MDTYNDLICFSSNLMARENIVKSRVQNSIRNKIFFRWFDKYFKKLEDTYRCYTRNMKIKVLKGFFLEKRNNRIKKETAMNKLRMNYQFKVWLALLKFLNGKK